MKKMPNTATNQVFLLTVLVTALCSASGANAGDQRPLAGPATGAEVAALIRDLGDTAYEVRTFATRRLCAIGKAAHDPLQAAADGADAETALRAKRVLAVLDALWFAGTEVSLAFSESKIAWDEPVDLGITITNRSAYPARIPFELGSADGDDDAQQVATMLDAAEWLSVRGPDGSPIELRVDDIAAHSEVLAAVQARLNGSPTTTLPPGERITFVARLFNRGWARFPLLDAGRYTAVLDYIPNWQDDALAQARVGRVRSTPAEITVTRAAPASVSRYGEGAEITIARDAETIVARLTNRSDLPAHLNINFGDSLPFAEGRWVHELNGLTHDVPVKAAGGANWRDFDESKFFELGAGVAIELARIDVAELHKMLVAVGAEVAGDRWNLHFSYANYCDRYWQARQGNVLRDNQRAPAILRNPLPRRVLTTRRTSNSLDAPGLE